jgi:hypothetical protein
MDFNTIINLLEYLGVFFGGILATIITTKWLQKEIVLTKRLFVQRIAYASESNLWGKIDVLYNGGPCNNLHFVTVELHNESNKNIEDVEVVFTVPELNSIYANSGEYKQDEIFTPLKLTNEYYQYFLSVAERNKHIKELPPNEEKLLRNEIDVVTRQKKYHIPVFNKNGMGVFSFLIDNATNLEPELMVSIIKKDVRLAQYQEEEDRKEHQKKWVGILNLLILMALCYPIAIYSTTIFMAVALMFGNVFISYILGLGLYLFIKWLKNFLN